MSNEIAVLMAAGLGQRMRPLTETMPKPLVPVLGKPMIETVIDALKYRGVSSIYVVCGYRGEQLKYLSSKYPGVVIVENKEYMSVNNISSIRAVCDVLGDADCFICEADLYMPDPSVLSGTHAKSCYYGKMVPGHSDDWVFDQDADGRITRVGKGGDDCYNMCGISFFLKDDAKKIADAVVARYEKPGYKELFWDEVVDSILPELDLTVYPIEPGSIVEIDTVDELKEVESRFGK